MISLNTDYIFNKSLLNANFNLIDGVAIHLYLKFTKKLNSVNRITGYDLFENLINKNLRFFFLGGSQNTSKLIRNKLLKKNVKVYSYSPPFLKVFPKKENKKIIKKINKFKPHILFIGMTAPKQEKWSYENRCKLNCNYIVNVGAVFDYYVKNYYRAPKFLRDLGLEWLFRLIQDPKLWKRVFVSGLLYFYYIFFLKNKNLFFLIF